MIYFEGNENHFDADELGLIEMSKYSVVSKLRQDGSGITNNDIDKIKFVGTDEITDEYVYEYESSQVTVPCTLDSYTKILNYVFMVKEKTESNRDLLTKKCNNCYRGNYTCNQSNNPRCLIGSIDECEKQIERLQYIYDYMKENKSLEYSTEWSKSMYTEVYKKVNIGEVNGYEAYFNTMKEKWETREIRFMHHQQIGISSNVVREVDMDFKHEKFSGSTDIIRSTDKSKIQMIVDYLNTGYTILCRNCNQVTFFDKEYIDGLKNAGKMNLPVRCAACKEKLVEMNK